MDADDLQLFERSVRNATSSHTGAALDEALADLGWLDALSVDPRAAIAVGFELQGQAGATSSALDHVLRQALGAAAEGTDAVVLPAVGGSGPAGRLDGERLVVDGLGSATLAAADTALVVAGADGATVAVPVPVADLDIGTIEGIDPGLGLVAVQAELGVAGDAVRPADTWPEAVRTARLAVGHELVGHGRRMLELARDHALDRVQFGRPISMFQAVRHRLAETLVALETADGALDAAWLDPTPEAAAMAKALAGRGARTAARHCQQVLAGIGFTTEHELHLHIRRVFVLDQLFGASRSLTRDLGEHVIATGRLPRLLPL